mgnify:FL=1
MHFFRQPEQWAKGLIGFTPEQAKQGALFVMHKAAPWPVCMDGLDIPIDIYWLSDSGMVLEHSEGFPGMGSIFPDVQSRLILELPMQELPLYRIGDFVEVPHDAPADS